MGCFHVGLLPHVDGTGSPHCLWEHPPNIMLHLGMTGGASYASLMSWITEKDAFIPTHWGNCGEAVSRVSMGKLGLQLIWGSELKAPPPLSPLIDLYHCPNCTVLQCCRVSQLGQKREGDQD